MSNFADTCVLSLPHNLCPNLCYEYSKEVQKLSQDIPIVIDFRHIKKVDYRFLHTLISMKHCLANSINAINFINYSSDIKDLFDEINVREFLGLDNLVHEHHLSSSETI